MNKGPLAFGRLLAILGLTAFVVVAIDLEDVLKHRGDPAFAWRSDYCRFRAICERYATAREDCAMAGDFKSCLSVRMDASDYAKVASCTSDGKVGWSTVDAPGYVECGIRYWVK